MKRKEEILNKSVELVNKNYRDFGIKSTHECSVAACQEIVEWADKTMIERACRCYCDILCEKGRCGMCFHKHDGEGQIKNDFKYNECYALMMLRNEMKQ